MDIFKGTLINTVALLLPETSFILCSNIFWTLSFFGLLLSKFSRFSHPPFPCCSPLLIRGASSSMEFHTLHSDPNNGDCPRQYSIPLSSNYLGNVERVFRERITCSNAARNAAPNCSELWQSTGC